MITAVHKVLKLRVDALLVGGPPCSSWTWVNAGTSGRSRSKPNGDQRKEYVVAANRFPGWVVYRSKCLWDFQRYLDLIFRSGAHYLGTFKKMESPNLAGLFPWPSILFLVGRTVMGLGLGKRHIMISNINTLQSEPCKVSSVVALMPPGRLTARWTLLILLATVRGVWSLTEQPNNSVMDFYQSFKHVQHTLGLTVGWVHSFLLGSQSISRQIKSKTYQIWDVQCLPRSLTEEPVLSWMCTFGHRCMKPSKNFGTAQGAQGPMSSMRLIREAMALLNVDHGNVLIQYSVQYRSIPSSIIFWQDTVPSMYKGDQQCA